MSDARRDPATLTAWQRWELPSFEPVAEADQVAAQIPTALQLEQMQQLAREEGYQAGYAEGMRQGRAEGLQQAQQDNERFTALLAALQSQLDDQVIRDLMELALAIAQQVVQQAITTRPELMLGMVREAVNAMPVFNQAAHLILRPQDAALVRERMGEQLAHSGWKILEDPHLPPGGARLETASSQLDATPAARWARVMAGLGQEMPWLISTNNEETP